MEVVHIILFIIWLHYVILYKPIYAYLTYSLFVWTDKQTDRQTEKNGF